MRLIRMLMMVVVVLAGCAGEGPDVETEGGDDREVAELRTRLDALEATEARLSKVEGELGTVKAAVWKTNESQVFFRTAEGELFEVP